MKQTDEGLQTDEGTDLLKKKIWDNKQHVIQVLKVPSMVTCSLDEPDGGRERPKKKYDERDEKHVIRILKVPWSLDLPKCYRSNILEDHPRTSKLEDSPNEMSCDSPNWNNFQKLRVLDDHMASSYTWYWLSSSVLTVGHWNLNWMTPWNRYPSRRYQRSCHRSHKERFR